MTDNGSMINPNVQIDDRSYISSSKFTEEERQVILRAKKIMRTDMPSFYHDAIVEVALKTVKDYANGSH